MKTLIKLLALAVPVLFAASCGGSGECNPLLQNCTGGNDMDICPAGTTLFRVQNGLYNTTMVTGIQDGCSLGLNMTNLSSQRNVVNDTTQGTVTVTSQDGTTILGTGPIKCNGGTIVSGPTTIETGNCRYSSTRSSAFTLTADNTFTLAYTETRSNWMTVPGSAMSCTTTAPCNIAFTLTMNKPVQ